MVYKFDGLYCEQETVDKTDSQTDRQGHLSNLILAPAVNSLCETIISKHVERQRSLPENFNCATLGTPLKANSNLTFMGS